MVHACVSEMVTLVFFSTLLDAMDACLFWTDTERVKRKKMAGWKQRTKRVFKTMLAKQQQQARCYCTNFELLTLLIYIDGILLLA